MKYYINNYIKRNDSQFYDWFWQNDIEGKHIATIRYEKQNNVYIISTLLGIKDNRVLKNIYNFEKETFIEEYMSFDSFFAANDVVVELLNKNGYTLIKDHLAILL
jgi:hypothetical protein